MYRNMYILFCIIPGGLLKDIYWNMIQYQTIINKQLNKNWLDILEYKNNNNKFQITTKIEHDPNSLLIHQTLRDENAH